MSGATETDLFHSGEAEVHGCMFKLLLAEGFVELDVLGGIGIVLSSFQVELFGSLGILGQDG